MFLPSSKAGVMDDWFHSGVTFPDQQPALALVIYFRFNGKKNHRLSEVGLLLGKVSLRLSDLFAFFMSQQYDISLIVSQESASFF